MSLFVFPVDSFCRTKFCVELKFMNLFFCAGNRILHIHLYFVWVVFIFQWSSAGGQLVAGGIQLLVSFIYPLNVIIPTFCDCLIISLQKINAKCCGPLSIIVSVAMETLLKCFQENPPSFLPQQMERETLSGLNEVATAIDRFRFLCGDEPITSIFLYFYLSREVKKKQQQQTFR